MPPARRRSRGSPPRTIVERRGAEQGAKQVREANDPEAAGRGGSRPKRGPATPVVTLGAGDVWKLGDAGAAPAGRADADGGETRMSSYQGRALEAKARRARRPSSLPRRIARVGAVLAVLVLLAHVPWQSLRSRLARVSDVRVEGAHYLDAARVVEISGLAVGSGSVLARLRARPPGAAARAAGGECRGEPPSAARRAGAHRRARAGDCW